MLFDKLDLIEEDAQTPTSQTINFVKDSKLKDILVTWAILNDLNIKRNRPSALEDYIKKTKEIILAQTSSANWRNIPAYSAFRELHQKYGKSPEPSSIENLIEFIKEKGDLPNINSFVDLYNVFSALTGISVGAHDLAKLSGDVRLTVLDRDLPFVPMNQSTPMTAKKGELAYVDDEGILCRLDIKQSNRTKVTKDTRDVFLIFEGNSELQQGYIEEKMEEFKELVKKYL